MRAPSICLALALAGCAASPVGEGTRERDAAAPAVVPSPAPSAAPTSAAPSPAPFAAVEAAMRAAVDRGEVPGAVCVVVRHGSVVARVAVGERAAGEPMTVDTVFDLASLTKPLATGLAVMQLVDAGRVRLDAKVARYLPAFGAGDVTVEELLLHTSGLPADTSLDAWRGGRAEATARALATPLEAAPGARVRYSDLGFVALGALVERVSGERLDAFTRRRVFGPLGLADTMFRPSTALASRAAPTESRGGRLLRGEVHDPRAAALDGVAGHAGLFSTAGDLASLGAAILQVVKSGARRDGLPSAPVLRDMLRPRAVPGGARALAWDVARSLSGARGAVALSHTGFTGTSITIDPASDTVVALLSSRLQAGARGDAKPVRRDVLEAVRAGLAEVDVDVAQPEGTRPRTGLDVLVDERFARFSGQRVGLVTNDAVVDREGVTTARRFAEAGVHVARMFTPEHGARARVEGAGGDAIDRATGAPVTRLYGDHARPSARDLEGVDVLVYDLPNVGARFFTYVTTLGLVLEAAAARRVPVVVLDRPPLVPVDRVAGPVLDDELRSFTGYDRM
ncbi:MAG TPA: serine hydrolase, partial [Byssovorax sp.]